MYWKYKTDPFKDMFREREARQAVGWRYRTTQDHDPDYTSAHKIQEVGNDFSDFEGMMFIIRTYLSFSDMIDYQFSPSLKSEETSFNTHFKCCLLVEEFP